MATKNMWEEKADLEAANKKWEEELGWENLDPERYCKELTEKNRDVFTMGANEYKYKYGSDLAHQRANLIDGQALSQGWNTTIVGLYSKLFSIVNQSAFPDTHDTRKRHLRAFVDPRKPTVTDNDILMEMGLSDPDAQSLKQFMRFYKKMKVFGQKVRTKIQEDLSGEYHQYEYQGEFSGVDRW